MPSKNKSDFRVQKPFRTHDTIFVRSQKLLPIKKTKMVLRAAKVPLDRWSSYKQFFSQSGLTKENMETIKRDNLELLANKYKQSKQHFNIYLADILHIADEANKLQEFDLEQKFSLLAATDSTLDFKGPALEFSFSFELKDRETQIHQLSAGICKSFLSALTQSPNKQDWNLFSISGGSGAGKTRLAMSLLGLLPKYIEENQQTFLPLLGQKASEVKEKLLASLQPQFSRNIYIDVSNGDLIPELKEHSTTQQAFLFSLVSKLYFPTTKVLKIKNNLKENIDKLTPSDAAKAIRSYFGVSKEQVVTLLFNLDEFQWLITDADINKLKVTAMSDDDKTQVLIRKIAVDIMQSVMILASDNIFIIPVFTGTMSTNYLRLLPATLYNLVPTLVGPIDLQSSQDIVNKVLKNNLPRSLVAAMGGVPRALQYLCEASSRNATATDKQLFGMVVDRIHSRYSFESPVPMKHLVKLCLLGQSVSRAHMVDGIALGTLERDGFIFLKEQMDGEKESLKLTVPLVFAAAMNKGMKLLDEEFLTYRPIVTLEIFGRDFEVFKNNLLVDMGTTTTTFGERFSGALMGKQLASKKLNLSRTIAFSAKNEALPSNGSVVEIQDSSSGRVDIERQAVSLWFGRKCTACDVLTSYPKQENQQTYFHLQEWKSTMVDDSISSQEVEKEKLQVQQLFSNPANRLFSKENTFFSFMTNKRLSGPATIWLQEQLHKSEWDDTMIVCHDFFKLTFQVSQQQFEQYYSKMFLPLAIATENLPAE